MLDILEGYDDELGFSIKKSFKKLKKNKVARIAATGGLSELKNKRLLKAAATGGLSELKNPKLMAAIKTGVSLVKDNPQLLSYAVTAAGATVGIPIPPQATQQIMGAMKAGKAAKEAVKKALPLLPMDKVNEYASMIDAKQKEQVKVIAKKALKEQDETEKTEAAQAQTETTEQATTEQATNVPALTPIAQTMQNILQKDKENQDEINNKSEVWTKEQINAFNQSQAQGKELDESYADAQYKAGRLQGDETTLQELLNDLSTKIFNSPKYPEIKYPSIEYVHKVIIAYMQACQALNKKTDNQNYYSGTTEKERKEKVGNIYVKITYMFFKGYTTETELDNDLNAKWTQDNYDLRDRIWIILSQVREYALNDSRYNAIWKVEKTAEIKQTESGKLKIKTPVIVAGASLAALLLLSKKKSR